MSGNLGCSQESWQWLVKAAVTAIATQQRQQKAKDKGASKRSVDANIQAASKKANETPDDRLTWFAGRQTVSVSKKGRAGVAVVGAQGTTVSLNAGWFMLPARCPRQELIILSPSIPPSSLQSTSQGNRRVRPVCAYLATGTELLWLEIRLNPDAVFDS